MSLHESPSSASKYNERVSRKALVTELNLFLVLMPFGCLRKLLVSALTLLAFLRERRVMNVDVCELITSTNAHLQSN